MATMIKFPEIGQFRNVAKDVADYCEHFGLSLPTVTFTGTVKLHGTNSSIGLTKEGTFWIQSRNRILYRKSEDDENEDKDNAGFAAYIRKDLDKYQGLLRVLLDQHESDKIVVYGEWCGGNIQKGVALSELPKMFVLFGILSCCGDKSQWLHSEVLAAICDADVNLYNIYQFPTFEVEVDFANPSAVSSILWDITSQVEKECPVGKYFGVSGVGEGVVWKGRSVFEDAEKSKTWIFKIKGETHQNTQSDKKASSKVISLEASEKQKRIDEFVEYAVTGARLEQGWTELFVHPGITPTSKDIGTFIKWVYNDVIKEESDTLAENGLIAKDISKVISARAKDYFLREGAL